MRKFFLTILVTILSFSFLISNVEAKRFGGGKSFGMSRSTSSFTRPNNNAYRAQPVTPPAASPASKWLGPLAGLAMGGLLASLFMGHGIGSGIMSWLMIAGVALLIVKLLQNFRRPVPQAAYYQSHPAQDFAANSFSNPSSNVYNMNQTKTVFDEVAFLRQAKSSFIRLQAAYDNKNLADLREFTAPEVFAEIQMQLQERGDEKNYTDVVHVDAQLLDLNEDNQTTIASVLFAAQIREQENASPENVKEIWHFRKESETKWVVAGIQQD